MRKIGTKKYLEKLITPSILRTVSLTSEDVGMYVQQKNNWVLKISTGGGSKGVFVGALLTDTEWGMRLDAAVESGSTWVMQEFCPSPLTKIIPHGSIVQKARVQLGVFILPEQSSPAGFRMDIVAKAQVNASEAVMFDPAGLLPDIWFGNVIVCKE